MSDDLLDLPEGWELVKLGDVIELKYGKSLTKSNRDGGQYPVYGSNGIVGFHSNFIVHNPCLIVGRKGSIGEIHISENPCYPIDTTYYIDNLYEQSINFWFYQLKVLPLEQLNRASAIPGLNREDAYKLPIYLPPLNEQKRIVAKIEELNDRSQAAQKALETIPQLCDRFRQSVLAAAFRGDLTADWREKNPDVEPASVLLEKLKKRSHQFEKDLSEYDLSDIPDSWLWVNVESIGDVKGGKRLPKGESLVDENTGYPYIKAGNLKNGTVILSEIQFIPKHIQPLIKNYTVVFGDVYITIVGACIGDAGIIPRELDGANLTENAAKICNLFSIQNEYLSLWLRSPLCQEIMKSKILSAAQGKLAITRIKTLPIPLPPIHEQTAIINILQDLINFPARVTKYQIDIKSKLEKLNQSILSKAFRGELVPQDPEDEPASVLLERIRAEREKLNNSKPKSTSKRKGKTPKEQGTIPGLE